MTEPDNEKLVKEGYGKITAHVQDYKATGRVGRAAAGKARVLDVGCGTGIPAAKVPVEYGCKVVGIEKSLELVKQAGFEIFFGSLIEDGRETHYRMLAGKIEQERLSPWRTE